MFRALLAQPQEVLHKRQLVHCLRVMSVCCTVNKTLTNFMLVFYLRLSVYPPLFYSRSGKSKVVPYMLKGHRGSSGMAPFIF
jgi:hypothetical protein